MYGYYTGLASYVRLPIFRYNVAVAFHSLQNRDVGAHTYDWVQLKGTLKTLARRLDDFALRCRKNLFHLSIKNAQRAENLALQCRRLAKRALTLPGGFDENNDQDQLIWDAYVSLRRQANNLMATEHPKPASLWG